MQLLINRSKFLILAVLACSIWIALFGSNNEFTDLDSATKKVTSSARPASSIWSSMSREFNLDHKTQSSQVQAEIRILLADREKLNKILKAASPYIYFIYKQTRARGLPVELALIPVIESEFNPNDHSNKGATGLWQLMPGTASELGVKVKSNYDGRRNVVASTKAALAYFKDLGVLFKGNWLLAIAAYNCGQVRVASATKRTGSNNFWQLPLPQETKHYVPKLLAVAAIVANPEKYGVKLPQVNNEPYFTEVKVNKPVNLAKVAEGSGISIETLHTLNPDHKHSVVVSNTKKDSTTTSLLVPVRKVEEVKEQLSSSLVSA